MSNTDYLTATVSVDQSPDEVFAAITNVRGWWNENIIGDTAALHDEFVFTDDTEYAGEAARSKDGIRFCRFQLTEVVPGERMVWRVVDAYLTFVEDRDEWTGTNVIFDITATSEGTSGNRRPDVGDRPGAPSPKWRRCPAPTPCSSRMSTATTSTSTGSKRRATAIPR